MNALCGMPLGRCPDCCSPMEHNFATFFTLNSEQSWTIPLPICLNRNPQLPTVSAA
jgi:hypothetical protein